MGSDSGCCVELGGRQSLFPGPVPEDSLFRVEADQFVFCTENQFIFVVVRQDAVDVVADECGIVGIIVGQIAGLVLVYPDTVSMCADISGMVPVLINGVDCSHIGGRKHFPHFLLPLVEQIKSVDGAYPQFVFALGSDVSDGVIRGVMFHFSSSRMDTLEIVISAGPYDAFFVAVDASDIFVRTDMGISFRLWGKVLRIHVFLVDSVHARHVSAYQYGTGSAFA